MSGHTPGPWALSGVSMTDGSISIAKDRVVLAYVTNAASFGDFINATLKGRSDFGAPDTAHTQFANARLMAAAPAMLEALKEAESHFGGPFISLMESDPDYAILKAIRAAISQATGSSQ